MTTDDKPFLTLRFDGGRFAAHSMPVEVLAEFAAFEKVFAALARETYFAENSDRKRLPRGFRDMAKLSLVSTAHNCFTGVLAWASSGRKQVEGDSAGLEQLSFFSDGELGFVGPEQMLDAAGTKMMAIFDALNDTGELPFGVADATLRALAAVGKNLHDDESITAMRDPAKAGVVINRGTRERLARLRNQPIEINLSVEGEVDAIDEKKRTFVVLAGDGKRYEAKYDALMRTQVTDALRARITTRVVVSGTVSVANDGGTFTGVEDFEVYEVDGADAVVSLNVRLDSLMTVEPGWLDGEGSAPAPEAIEAARQVLGRVMVNHGIPRPGVFPNPEGGIQAEWMYKGWVIEARFDSLDILIDVVATAVKSGIEDERLIDRVQQGDTDVRSLAEFILGLEPQEPSNVQ